MCTVGFIGIVFKKRKRSQYLFMSEANFHSYRFNFFLASRTTINSADRPTALPVGDAFPYILTARASSPRCSRSDPGSPMASARPREDPSPSLSLSFIIYKLMPRDRRNSWEDFCISQFPSLWKRHHKMDSVPGIPNASSARFSCGLPCPQRRPSSSSSSFFKLLL